MIVGLQTITGQKNCQSINSTGVRMSTSGLTAGDVTGQVVVEVKMESVAIGSRLRSSEACRN